MGRQVFKWAILFCILYLCSGEETNDDSDEPKTTKQPLTKKLEKTAKKLEKDIERVEKLEKALLAVANATSPAPIKSEEEKPAASDNPIHVVIDKKKTEDPVDCDDNPCENGGTCEDTTDGGVCKCKDEFTGPTCSETDAEAPSGFDSRMLYLIVAAALGIILITSASIFIIFIIQVRNERARLQKEYTEFLKRNTDLPQMTWKRLAKSVLRNRLNALTCGAICCPSKVQDQTRAEIEELIRLEEEEKRQLELERQCERSSNALLASSGMSHHSARLHQDATEERRPSAARTTSAGTAASARASSHRSAASKRSNQATSFAKTASGMSRMSARTTSRMSRGSISNPAFSESADDFDNPEDTPLLTESD